MVKRKLRVLIVGDGKSNIISENFIDFLYQKNNFVFDIISFKKNFSRKYYRKVYSIPEVLTNSFKFFHSLRFFVLFIIYGSRIIRKYDIVHFHMFYSGIFFLTPFFKDNIILTIWGSDFLRSNKLKNFFLSYTLKKVKIVTCTSSDLANELVKSYPNIKNKLQVIPYILKYVGLINDNYSKRSIFKKTRIVVGSNSNYAQNHLKILNAIKLSKIKKKSIHIILPFSYGRGSENYKKKVYNYASSIGCTFEIINDRLNDDDLVELRLNSDIFINLQQSDQLSGAMLETLCANNIVITGKWLNYKSLNELGIKFYEINNFSELPNILNTINFFSKPKNRKIITNMYSPLKTLNKWSDIYESIKT